MAPDENIIEPLFDKVKDYSKTSLELLKLRSIDRSSDFLSSLIFRLIVVSIILLALLSLNIAAALWLGDLTGKVYFGFLLVSSFYIFIGIILRLFRTRIKLNISNSIINSLTTVLCKK